MKFGNQHALKHGMSHSPEYHTWEAMKQRCFNPHRPKFRFWGGRGITVCERWLKFENFLADMGQKPTGMTLERIDGDKDYCKENCCWASFSDQNRNRRPYHKKRILSHECRESNLCCCSSTALEPKDNCPVHSSGPWPPRCEICGRFMKRRI